MPWLTLSVLRWCESDLHSIETLEFVVVISLCIISKWSDTSLQCQGWQSLILLNCAITRVNDWHLTVSSDLLSYNIQV